MLRTEQLGFWYQDPQDALYKDVELNFEAGKMYAILGASGSGKTTFLSLISGLDAPKEGKVYYQDRSLNKIGLRSYRKNDVSIIFQAYNLLPYLSALDNVIAAMEITKTKQENYRQVALDRLAPVGIDEKLAKKAEELNREQFSALHYTAPGTDIIIGLPKNHLWEGAGSYNARGEKFMANMPTEEVFTAPDSHRVDGYISSTKPLSYAGTIISGMKFTFKDGKVVDFSAEQGEDVLAKLLDTDEGARRLGEVALVPDPSPISQSGIIFFNTLFDENASNHLALGSAYAFSVKGGTEMSDEELAEAGLNRSQTHVDFMVGSDKMDIDGIREDGSTVPIFRNGDWA